MQTIAWLAETFGYLFLFYALWEKKLTRNYWPVLAAFSIGVGITEGLLMLANHFLTGTRQYAIQWFWIQIPVMLGLVLNAYWIVYRVSQHYREYWVMLPWLSVILTVAGGLLLIPTLFLDAWAARGLTYGMIVLQRAVGTNIVLVLVLLYGFTRLIPRTNIDGQNLPFSRNVTTVWTGTLAYMALYTVQFCLAAFSHQHGAVVQGYNVVTLTLVALVLFAMGARLRADGEVFEPSAKPDPVLQEQSTLQYWTLKAAQQRLRDALR